MLLYVTTISLNTLFITTPQGLIMLPWGKVFSWMLFPCNFRKQTAFKDDQAALTELLRVKKNNINSMAIIQCKNIIMLYKTPIHVLVWKVGCKTHVLFSISAVILKLMVKITSISSSYRFLRIECTLVRCNAFC